MSFNLDDFSKASPLSKAFMRLLVNWVDNVLDGTGRFDQKEPSKQFPSPSGVGIWKSLLVFGSIEKAIIDDPTVIEQFMPHADGTYVRPKPGAPWHEFEQACLIEEVAELQRTGGFNTKSAGTNMFRFLSNRLNTRYGIDRSENSVKNTWYRELRARSGIDERAAFRSPGKNTSRLSDKMRVSLTGSPRRRAGRGAARVDRRGETVREALEARAAEMAAKLDLSTNQQQAKQDQAAGESREELERTPKSKEKSPHSSPDSQHRRSPKITLKIKGDKMTSCIEEMEEMDDESNQ
jgi:hypothetical protein